MVGHSSGPSQGPIGLFCFIGLPTFQNNEILAAGDMHQRRYVNIKVGIGKLQ